ncbi:hypothetical protein EV2_046532 [Malus domestica]
MKLSKRCECGAILQFEGMFCLGVAGADQLPYKMDLLLRCNNGLLSLICRLSRGGDLIRNTVVDQHIDDILMSFLFFSA